MNCQLDRSILSAYIDGELSREQAAELERHLAACEGCRAELAALRRTADLLRGLPSVALPGATAEAIEARLKRQAAAERRVKLPAAPRRVHLYRWALAANLAALAACAILVISLALRTAPVAQMRSPSTLMPSEGFWGDIDTGAKEGAIASGRSLPGRDGEPGDLAEYGARAGPLYELGRQSGTGEFSQSGPEVPRLEDDLASRLAVPGPAPKDQQAQRPGDEKHPAAYGRDAERYLKYVVPEPKPGAAKLVARTDETGKKLAEGPAANAIAEEGKEMPAGELPALPARAEAAGAVGGAVRSATPPLAMRLGTPAAPAGVRAELGAEAEKHRLDTADAPAKADSRRGKSLVAPAREREAELGQLRQLVIEVADPAAARKQIEAVCKELRLRCLASGPAEHAGEAGGPVPDLFHYAGQAQLLAQGQREPIARLAERIEKGEFGRLRTITSTTDKQLIDLVQQTFAKSAELRAFDRLDSAATAGLEGTAEGPSCLLILLDLEPAAASQAERK